MAYRRRHFSELVKNEQPYTYGDLLNTYEWLNIRERILKLDGGRCKKCKKYGTKKRNQEYFEDWLYAVNKPRTLGNRVEGPTYLEVHHSYYIQGYLPWQYEDDCYLTLLF